MLLLPSVHRFSVRVCLAFVCAPNPLSAPFVRSPRLVLPISSFHFFLPSLSRFVLDFFFCYPSANCCFFQPALSTLASLLLCSPPGAWSSTTWLLVIDPPQASSLQVPSGSGAWMAGHPFRAFIVSSFFLPCIVARSPFLFPPSGVPCFPPSSLG